MTPQEEYMHKMVELNTKLVNDIYALYQRWLEEKFIKEIMEKLTPKT
jgi:hypothetical protein